MCAIGAPVGSREPFPRLVEQSELTLFEISLKLSPKLLVMMLQRIMKHCKCPCQAKKVEGVRGYLR